MISSVLVLTTKEENMKLKGNIRSIRKAQLVEYIDNLEAELESERDKRREDGEVYEAMIADCEDQIGALKMQILELKGKIISKDIELNSYKDKVGEPIISKGKEQDIYQGEQRDFILSLLEKHMKSTPPYTRSHTICKSILDGNPPVGVRKSMIETIMACFKNKFTLDSKTICMLKNIGIDCDSRSSHHKLRFHNDDRYFTSVAKTPADKANSIRNSGSDLLFRFF